MPKKFYIFPEPLDSICVITTDAGVVMQAVPDIYIPGGQVCQSYTIPDSVPNGNGAWQEISHPDKVTDRHHGILCWGELAKIMPKNQAAFFIDVFPLANPSRPWPPIPTRDDVCRVLIGFQGVTIQSQEFGAFPAFGPETSSLNDEDLRSYFDQIAALGWTHVEFAVSWNYRSNTYQYPVPGRDLSQNLPELKRRIVMAIRRGFKAALFCAGDGEGYGPGYNDPVGWTFGRQWLMNNFQRIYDAMGPTAESQEDCRPFMVFLPGYDGTDSYAWVTPENVVNWWNFARHIIDRGGVGYLGQEYSIGHCQIGGRWDGEATYVDGPGRALDVILQEFPASPPMPTANPNDVWQMCGRMVHPYHRDPDQIDDPTPPYYLRQGTPRGPYYYVAFEYDTYNWVRGQVTSAQVESDRQYLRARGCAIVC